MRRPHPSRPPAQRQQKGGRHHHFQARPRRSYYDDPKRLNFRGRMGSGALLLVWSRSLTNVTFWVYQNIFYWAPSTICGPSILYPAITSPLRGEYPVSRQYPVHLAASIQYPIFCSWGQSDAAHGNGGSSKLGVQIGNCSVRTPSLNDTQFLRDTS